MEPWDGPASIPFTDGDYIGALLDRNGLRPSRYSITKDGRLIMSSEIGVIDIQPENILSHGRLEPGKMFLVDMNKGRIINDDEIKNKITTKRPYGKWIKDQMIELKDIPYSKENQLKESISFKNKTKTLQLYYRRYSRNNHSNGTTLERSNWINGFRHTTCCSFRKNPTNL